MTMAAPIQIDGRTRLYVIVGDPVVQVKSATVYSQLFADLGKEAVLVPLHVLPADIDALAPQFETMRNLDGILVTAPYKSRLLGLCRSLGAAAQCVGAVNALRRHPQGGWHGDLFDGAGFVTGARRRGIELGGRRILQFGAGGAGSAIAYELAAAGVKALRLIDPHPEKVSHICAAIRSRFPEMDIQAAGPSEPDVDMVINASTVGMGGAPGLPGPIPTLSSAMAVGEVNVTAQGTELIRLAQASGAAWVDGSFMHTGQIDQIMAFFFNEPAQSS
jgi:shikimate dehydrogenase